MTEKQRAALALRLAKALDAWGTYGVSLALGDALEKRAELEQELQDSGRSDYDHSYVEALRRTAEEYKVGAFVFAQPHAERRALPRKRRGDKT